MVATYTTFDMTACHHIIVGQYRKNALNASHTR
jgi:hypothetical protein